MSDGCKKISQDLSPEEIAFYYTSVIAHPDSGENILFDSAFSLEDIKKFSKTFYTQDQGLMDLFRSCPEIAFERGKEFFKQQNLVEKEEGGVLYLNQQAYLKALFQEPEYSAVLKLWLGAGPFMAWYEQADEATQKREENFEKILLIKGSRNMDVWQREDIFQQQYEKKGQEIFQASLDLNGLNPQKKTFTLQGSDLKEYANRLQIPEELIQQYIEVQRESMAWKHSTFESLYLLSLTEQRDLDLTDYSTNLIVTRALYEFGEYEKAVIVLKIIQSDPDAEKGTIDDWVNYLEDSQKRAQQGLPVLRTYEVLTTQGSELRPFSELLGLPSFDDSPNFIPPISAVRLLPTIDSSSWSLENTLSIEDPFAREYVLGLLHSIYFKLTKRHKRYDVELPLEARVVVKDPEKFRESMDILKHIRTKEFLSQILENKDYAEKKLDLELPAKHKNFVIYIDIIPGSRGFKGETSGANPKRS